MNKQRKVVITTTYNEMGIIIDTMAEEVTQPNLQPTCNQLATDCISRQDAIDAIVGCTTCRTEEVLREYVAMHNLEGMWSGGVLEALYAVKDLSSAQPYTAEEIDKMQELEAVQLEKAHELGRESVQSEITCNGCRYERFGNRVCYQCSRFYMDRYEVKQDE